MIRYSVQPRDFFGFLSFARNMDKHVCKNVSKN